MSSGTTATPVAWHEPILSTPESELEAKMNDGLRNYIRDSLFGMPNDLPEIKGLRAKLPEAYTGEDDFERFENWVQGLLRYFKLHRLTGEERDGDRVLVAGSCLKGQAETWFNHEVERPQRIIRDWTFEYVALGLQQAFITTATPLQAVQKYAQIRFSRENGIHAFYRDLLMWAGRLAQYPDAYSFKQRLLNGLPTEYRNHLVLYEGISAEHSSIDDIVQKTRRYEKILVTLKPGRTGEKDNNSISKTRHPEARVERSGQQLRPRAFRPQKDLTDRQGRQRPTQNHLSRERRDGRDTRISTGKADASKLSCFTCGKVGHFSNDPKCPQYKKPEKRQMFAAQVVNDLSDGEATGQANKVPEGEVPNEDDNYESSTEAAIPPEEDDGPEGTQYDEDSYPEDPHLDEYDGYTLPADESDLEYMRFMVTTTRSTNMPPLENGSDNEPLPMDDMQVDESDSGLEESSFYMSDSTWKSRRDAIRDRYQRSHWIPYDQWEFRPHIGATHIRNCVICAEYKAHVIAADMHESITTAWKTRDRYEQDLVTLGWTLALEDHPAGPEKDARAALGAKIDILVLDIQKITLHLEAAQRSRDEASRRNKELQEELEYAQLSASLYEGEADLWKEQHDLLKAQLVDKATQETIAEINVAHEQNPQQLMEETRCAAARDKIDTVREQEFRAAHSHKESIGKRPNPSSEDRHCMAIHVKVNGLDAYALLDSGCTTVSITHDFARVAKLRVTQLENPVTLQLGTVGSRSMINFGAISRLELGTIKDDNAYMDVVNIDRYDMIIGIPFMRKHSFVLDFDKDRLLVRGQVLQPLTVGQEDLLMAKRRPRLVPRTPKAVRAPPATI